MKKIKCPECDGLGFIVNLGGCKSFSLCEKCQGIGTLDWVEKICGKKNFSFEEVKGTCRKLQKKYPDHIIYLGSQTTRRPN